MRGLVVLTVLTMAGCAPKAFRVVKPGAEYALAAPGAKAPVVFSQLMERAYGFKPGQGYIDLLPGMRLAAQRAYFRGTEIKLSEYLGAETARWMLERGARGLMRFRPAGVEAEAKLEKPPNAPPVEKLIDSGMARQRLYRMFFQVKWYGAGRSTARGSVLLGAADAASLAAATEALLGEQPVDCGARLDCVIFPLATTVTAEIGIAVNGEPKWVVWGSTVQSLNPAGATLRMERQRTPVVFPRGEPNALRLPLLPGDRVSW